MLIQRLPLLACGLLSVVGCSGRVVTSDTPGAVRNDGGTAIMGAGAADANAESGQNALPASLLSLPSNETMLETFSSAVEAPGATHYRAAIVDGKDAACTSLGPLRKMSEILTLPVGDAGEKTICLQAAHEKGLFGNLQRFNFKKKNAPGDYPELAAAGAPQWYTAGSAATVSIISADAIEYRASFSSILSSTAPCKTLERYPWVKIDQSLSLKFAYDGPWQLCAEVRDKFGRKSLAPQSHVWTRDTIYPVPAPLALPDSPTTDSEFIVSVSGNLVDSYQHVLVEGNSTCAGISYPPVVPASTPLKIKLTKDGLWTVCLMTESKNGYKQQSPLIQTIQKVSPVVQKPTVTPSPENPNPQTVVNPVAKVSIVPVPVSASKVPLSSNRAFTISGSNVTRYKSFSYDYSTVCPMTPPAGSALDIKTKLNVSFSANGIKTLCVWGIHVAADGQETMQAIATWFRFYNDTNYSMIGKNVSNPVPFTQLQAFQSCSCHDSLYSESDWKARAPAASARLRNNTMPPTGWNGRDEQKAGLMAYLATIPGYPVDMPYVISSP